MFCSKSSALLLLVTLPDHFFFGFEDVFVNDFFTAGFFAEDFLADDFFKGFFF